MKILLAVSGGIDSMYMAERALEGALFADLVPCTFAVAHCNFNLRGAESDSDEAFVRSWCTSHEVELFCTSFDTAAYASANGISIEMAARELRYSWFADICRTHGFDALAVAHNSNDNAETLLLNLLRGTGLRGVRGMQPQGLLPAATVSLPLDPTRTRFASSGPPSYDAEGGTGACGEQPLRQPALLRPLLKTSRAEIEQWMRDNGKDWREDSTNASAEYKRNRIRCNVFPEFAQINPSFLRTLNADMERFAQADDIVEDWFASVSEGLVDANGGIRLKELLKIKHWKYVLWRLTEQYNFSEDTFGKLTELLERYAAAPVGTVTLSSKVFQTPTHTLTIKRTTLVAQEK